jgi:hypothetical protein
MKNIFRFTYRTLTTIMVALGLTLGAPMVTNATNYGYLQPGTNRTYNWLTVSSAGGLCTYSVTINHGNVLASAYAKARWSRSGNCTGLTNVATLNVVVTANDFSQGQKTQSVGPGTWVQATSTPFHTVLGSEVIMIVGATASDNYNHSAI